MGAYFGYQAGDLPVTEEYSDRLVRLPFYNSLSQTEQQQVINTILTFKV
jgi:dTDP-4-amino-4,6-dideoxygalactose transaminase